jgi:MFS family permease
MGDRGENQMTKTQPGDGRYSLLMLFFGMLTVLLALGLGRFAYTMILPGMRDGLGLNYTETGLLATANFVGYSLAALGGGLLAARYGPRLVIAFGATLVGGTMILTGLAPVFTVALVMRFLTGVGSAACVVAATSLQISWFSPRRRGLATGGISGGAGLGLVVSGAFIPLIFVAHGPDGWRYAWFYLGLLGLLVAALAAKFVRNTPEELGQVPFGSREQDYQAEGLIAVPPRLRDVYRSRSLYYLGLTYAVWGFSYIIFATFFAAYLADERGLDAAFAGRLWATAGVVSTGSGLLWGSVSDWIGRRWGLAVVFLLQAMAFVSFSQVESTTGLWVATLVYGATAFSIPAIIGATVGDMFGPRLAAAGIGFVTLIFGIGQAIGPSIGGLIADQTGSFELAFLLSGAGALAGCVLASAFRVK